MIVVMKIILTQKILLGFVFYYCSSLSTHNTDAVRIQIEL